MSAVSLCSMTTTRRDFLQTLLALGGATAALSAVGCGDDDGPAGSDSGTPRTDAGRDSGTTPDEDAGTTPDEDAGTTPEEDAGTTPEEDAGTTPTGCESVDGTVDDNHGHTVVIPAADVADPMDRTYNIQGTSRHPHTITVTAANFETLAAGGTVTVSSSRDSGHSHEVTLVCG